MTDAPNDLLAEAPNPRAILGGNQPPLIEQLAEETAPLRERADELVMSARHRAIIATDEDAEKATLLFAMMREHYHEIDKARTERKAPYLRDGRIIDNHFRDILLPLVGADSNRIGGAAGELLARVNAWRRQKEAEAAAERRRLEDEARQARQAAEDAERARLAAEEAQRQAQGKAASDEARRQKAEAELDRRRAEDEAAALEARAAEPQPVTISSGYGPKASGRITRDVEITDLRKAVARCLVIDRHRIEEAVLAIYRAQVRAGVRDLIGARIIEDQTTIIRR